MRTDLIKWFGGAAIGAVAAAVILRFAAPEGPAYFYLSANRGVIEFTTLERCHEMVDRIYTSLSKANGERQVNVEIGRASCRERV